MEDFKNSIISDVNGHPIRRLEDLAAAFAEPTDYYVIRCVGEGRPIVLERAKVEAARQRIKTVYNVTSEENLAPTPATPPAGTDRAEVAQAKPVASTPETALH